MFQGKIHRDLFSTPEMRDIWSEPAMVSGWLKIEQALASAQAELELIPEGASAALAKVAPDDFDHNRLARETLLVGRPIVGFIRQLREMVGPEYGPYIHFGTTTQDIIDTASILMMRTGLDLIGRDLGAVIKKLDSLAESHAQTWMIGRTNGQHAKPITFGRKLRLWAAELERRLAVIKKAAQSGLLVQLGGPVGELEAFDRAAGIALRNALAGRLGLSSRELAWQNARDRVGDIILALGQLGGSVEKISHNVNLLSSTEIGELYETPANGKGGLFGHGT